VADKDEYQPWPYEPWPVLSREPAGFWEPWPFEAWPAEGKRD
jgi:hypothetical protein